MFTHDTFTAKFLVTATCMVAIVCICVAIPRITVAIVNVKYLCMERQ
jgi:hypothetical protein